MKLYGFPLSPNTWKVRAVAAHLGIKLDLEIVDLTKPRTAAYLAIHKSFPCNELKVACESELQVLIRLLLSPA